MKKIINSISKEINKNNYTIKNATEYTSLNKKRDAISGVSLKGIEKYIKKIVFDGGSP